MKYIVLVLFIFIIYSLGSALYYMVKDGSQSKRMVKSLAMRVGFSILLFIILIISKQMGWIDAKPARFLIEEKASQNMITEQNPIQQTHVQKQNVQNQDVQKQGIQPIQKTNKVLK